MANDFKSKLPDFQELTSMTSKLFKDVKKSVTEIMCDYKKKRAEETVSATSGSTDEPKTTEKKSAPRKKSESEHSEDQG